MDEPLTHARNYERAYETYEDGRFLKRSLAPYEYKLKFNGDTYVPIRNRERLENEAACLRFIAESTDIPVPRVLGAYEENSSYYLWTEHIQGVALRDLQDEEKLKVVPNVEKHLKTLESLRSNLSGGPTGILCPQTLVASSSDPNVAWRRLSSTIKEFVFCHCDLSQSNIIVDPHTMNIAAIVDWEYSGWYPRGHEIPFYLKKTPSGGQMKNFPDQVKEINKFWEDSLVQANGNDE